MSKKDKKRIAELERQQSILAAKVRIMQYYIGQLYAAKEQPAAFQSGTISSEPKQPETAADSPTRDGAIYDKTKCVAYEQGEQVLNKSTFDWLKQTRPKQDKSEQEKPRKFPSTPEMKKIEQELEQELLAQLNAELAKFASLEAFNADRKNFFLPPVGKLEFDKMKAAIECTIAIAKMVRPDYFDKINQIKVPTSEQPEAEPKQGSDGADSPKKGSFIKGVFKGKSVNFDADELDAKLRELEALPLKSEYEAAEQTKAAIEQMQQDSPKQEPTFQSQLDEYHAELSDKIISEMNKTMEFWAGVFGLQASKQDETKQPEINHYDPAKATLNKMVLSHVGEMKLWLSLREHSTTEIAQAIQILVDDLGLHLADFRRKVLDLGRVEPCKVEPKETLQCEEKQQETEQNSDGGIWVIHNKLDKTWAAKCSEGGFFWANEKHEEGVLQYADQKEAIEHYNALCSRGLISRMKQQHTAVIREEKQPETDQPTPEKDSENQPEKQQFYLIQTNPNKDQRLNAFYVEMINEKNIVQHTPDPNAAMNFIDADAAQTEIDTIIANSAGRYDAADFKIVEKP
jgi:hypothetical protein